MENDFISRGIALAVIKNHCEAVTEGMKSTPIFDTYKMAHDHIADAIKAIPAVDVMPKMKEAAIDYLREIGWLDAHDLSIMGHVE